MSRTGIVSRIAVLGFLLGASATLLQAGATVNQGAIGDFVWKDTNHNGVQDAGEPGINGVTVKLCSDPACTNVLASAVTITFKGNDGYYQFTGLSARTYYVSVDVNQPMLGGSGLIPTQTGQGNPATDSNVNPCTVILPTSSAQDETIDFGFTPPGTAAIGDFVWNDSNGNGIQDNGEAGIPGVKVNLCSDASCLQVIATTTTDQNGAYHFTGLFGGTYYVVVDATTVPAGFAPTPNNAPGSNTTNDSNGSPAQVILPDNTIDNTIDFGYVPPALGAIGDFVWHDLNRNGIQDVGEPGINNVTVKLCAGVNCSSVLQTTTTVTHLGQDGYYQFTGVKAGTYYVVVDASTLPAGYTPATNNAPGGTPANDSNGSPATVVLANNSSVDETIDFGYLSPCAGVIGDFVWNDINQNGIQDNGEPGMPGVKVSLFGPSHVFIMDTTTDNNGLYQFTGRCAAAYTVEVVTPAGYQPTQSNAPGSTPANDSNGSPATVNLGIDETNLTIDFGFFSPAQLQVMKTPDNGSFTMGGGTSFTIVVSNPAAPGSAAATNVMLTDALPANGGLTWNGASTTQGSCSITNNVLNCSLGTIPAGGSVTVIVSTPSLTPVGACQSQPNPAANATADGGLSATDSGSLTCTPPQAQLKVVKTPDGGSFNMGGQASFTIVVSNPAIAGSQSATNVMLRDALPTNGGLTWASFTTTQGSCTLTNNTLNCSLGTIAAQGSVTVMVSSPATTPASACMAQPNPAANATASGGLSATDSGSLTCTIPPPPCGTNLAPLSYNVNEKGNDVAGEIVWFNSHLVKLGGTIPTSDFTLYIQNGQITFGPSTLAVPNAVIKFTSSVGCSSTSFDTASKTWITTLPLSAASSADEIFAAGLAYQLPATFAQNINNVTWSATVLSTAPGLQVSWQYGVSNWLTTNNGTSFPVLADGSPDYDGMKINPAHNAPLCDASYNTGDHAGAPEFTGRHDVLTGGGSGGGGSNWTGSWSSTPPKVGFVCSAQ